MFTTRCLYAPSPLLPNARRESRFWPRITSPVRCNPPKTDAIDSTIHSRIPMETIRTGAMFCGFLTFSVTNRVIYKMALVPMKEYVFFLSQLLSGAYVLVYVSILCIRIRMGKVTKEMLEIPKINFVLIGSCEALANLTLMICTAHLPGIILPILQQLGLVWQLILSALILKRKYTIVKILGVSCVIVGSILSGTATAGLSEGGQASIPYMLLMNVVFILLNISVITKEKIFVQSRQRLGRNIDVFVVSSFGSIAQAIGTMLLFPFILQARNMNFQEFPTYLRESFSCFCGSSLISTSDCSGAPFFPLCYIAVNILMNISVAYLVRSVGALVTILAGTIAVPTTVAVFTLPLPYLGTGTRLSLKFLTGCCVLVIGMLIYASKDIMQFQKQTKPSQISNPRKF